MDSDDGSSLLTKLNSTDLHHIHHLFSSYLHPFTDLTLTTVPNPKQKSKNPSKNPPSSTHTSTVRSLAKRFLPFLNRSLSLLHKRLSQTPKIDDQSALELFTTYKLCLDCLDCVSSQLECKPYAVHVQRVRLMHCFEVWGKYGDAQVEGFFVLERLRGIEIGGNGSKKAGKKKVGYVPVLGTESVDHDFAVLVVEIAVTIVNCVYMSQSKEEGDYRKVIDLVDEAAPWFRVLDASAYEKMHRVLVTYLNRCTLFLVGELMNFNSGLVREFCSATFAEYSKSVMKDQLQKFARRICSSLFSVQGNQSSSISDILTFVLDFMAGECKVEMKNTTIDFIELVDYCANKCRTVTRSLCCPLATYVTNIAGECSQVLPPYDMLLKLFGTGLFVSDWNNQSRQGGSITSRSTKDGSGIAFLIDKEDLLNDLAALIGRLKCYFHTRRKAISLPITAELQYTVDAISQIDSQIIPNHDTSRVCKEENGKQHILSYCNALKFLCQPLADFVNSARKEIVAETEGSSFPTKLSIIQDAFHQFIDAFLFCNRACEWESHDFDDYKNTVVSVAVAALTLSFRTKLYLKESASFVKQVIFLHWIRANDLKYIFASLYNVGVTLYRNKLVKEASVAVKFCCRASWTCVSYLCESFANKSNSLCNDVSEDAITNIVGEACAKSAFLLDLLYQCNSHNKLSKIMGYSLEKWSAAENVFNRLPSPAALVKQWVKIECKLSTEPDTERIATTLYSLLSSSERASTRSLSVILEQELLAYQDISALYPGLCHKMQMDIIDVLVEKVYVTDDNCLQRCKCLIAKGRVLRASGIEGLKGCIKYLSDVISMMNDMNGGKVLQSLPICHQLAVAYSLRALCIHEAEPNSKQPFEDIQAALNLWLRPDCCLMDNVCDMALENMQSVLYHVVDMLSMKGFTKFHHHLYELLIRLFKRKNVPPEKYLASLWHYRRLGHALCASPVSEGFITTFSQHCGEFSKSIKFWKSSMSGSLPLEVGFQQSFSFILTNFSHGSCNIEYPFPPNIKVDEVKQAALDLTSKVPLCTSSIFLAAHLYHDLSVRMVSTGQIIEALSYAKEAHHLRSKLLKEKFRYSVEQQSEVYDENGAIIQKRCYRLSSFHMSSTVATAVWGPANILSNMEGCILTPWNVLQCYLESILQVGIIYELIGDGSEAETLLLWGKSISSFQDLPLFKVAFSSVLGILYRKQRLWDLAEKELYSAKQILADCFTTISCFKCRLIFEVTIDLHLGDLFRSPCDKYTEKLSVCAETLYKSALDKLNLSEWKNSVSNPEDIGSEIMIVHDAVGTTHSDIREFPSKVDAPEMRIEAKKSRKTKKELKQLQGQCLVGDQNSRITRSRYRSQRTNENIPCDVQVGLAKNSNNEQHLPDALSQGGPLLKSESPAADSGCKVTCICNKMKCWYCLPMEFMESGSITDFVQMKWEFARRRLLLKVLTGIGKCLGARGEIHGAHELFLKSISVLVSRNLFSGNSPVPRAVLLEMIGKDIPGDPLAVERATVIYNLCWFTLKSYPCKDTRTNSCTVTHIQISTVLSWMMLAFVLSREIPVLVQKVSRLLAAIFVLSAATEIFSPYVSPCKTLSESHWASYFHQASLGTHLNLKLLSSLSGKQKIQDPIDVEGFCLPGSSSIASERLNLLRLAPETFKDLEGYVLRFFQSLPCTTIVGLSLLGGALASLLTELLGYPSYSPAWILLSRLHSDCQPVVLLLPVDSILEGNFEDFGNRNALLRASVFVLLIFSSSQNLTKTYGIMWTEATDDYTRSSSGILFEEKSFAKRWHCPWGSNVVDDLAPEFKRILEENFSSSSMHHLEDTKDNRSLWWMQRNSLDQRLSKFLSNLEDLWFGPWKFLLLGEFSGCKQQEAVLRKLMHNLKVKCNVDAQEGLLKVILGGAKHVRGSEECILQLILGKGCFIGYSNQERLGSSSDTCYEVESVSKSAFKLTLEAFHEIDEGERLNREPVILVLDFDVQMLPWESLPIVRNQEVYRMPSIGSIFATLDRCCQFQEHDARSVGIFPLIDPLDAFYLLNPSGDLSGTQDKFEDFFRERDLEGKAGTAPTIEELAVALRSHDLFIYFGHGSGLQFIPEQEIQKLQNCAATLLMGCSSGSLSLNGSYTPQGAPLCYLLAGSPVIVANLWEVTDKDIDRFAKAMFDCCLEERLTDSVGCVQCNLITEKFKSMQITGTKGNAKKKTSRKTVLENLNTSVRNDRCNHRPKIGSFMGQARKACKLPYLIGASPVCYGVPTGISRKKDL